MSIIGLAIYENHYTFASLLCAMLAECCTMKSCFVTIDVRVFVWQGIFINIYKEYNEETTPSTNRFMWVFHQIY